MRSRISVHAALLCLLSTLLLCTPAARAADDTTADEYEERARVLRVSLTKGEVSLLRAGESEWERAPLNTPLVEGDTLSTGRDSRLEIQADSRNFIRVGPDSVIKVVTLRDEGIALSISEGTATFRLSRFDKDREYFEVDAPRTTIAAERTGQYRVDVLQDGAVRVTVREDGRARVYSNNSGFELRSGRTASLYIDDAGEADWDLARAADFDEWDLWNREREQHLAARLKYEGRERYYDKEVYGAEELDLYGDWQYTREYGYVWRPHTTVVNNYHDWAPYRYGRWVWCNPYGWTWVADEDWGWAPYHYGRWVYYNNNWCWAPRGYGYNYGRAWWRPALVTFVNINIGGDRHVCWYPLTYGQRDPRGRWWSRRHEPLTPLRRREVDNLRRANPALLRAVTTARAREFGVENLRARPAAQDVAQRALAGEPVLRGQLPAERPNGPRVLAPGGGGNNRVRRPDGREVLTIARPTPVGPARSLPDRDTGAAARTPGVPLDSELRRTRVFNNREPRVAPETPAGTQAGVDTTGAVERRDAPRRNPSDSGGGGETPRVRPVRTAPPIDMPRTDTNPSTIGDSERVRRREPDTRNDDVGVPRVRPTRPREERPPVDNQPRNDDRPSAPPVINRPEPRTRPDEGERRPSSPPRREEPAPSRPEPRREAPPPRQEQPRQEQPRQEAPRQESPRQETPRQERPRESPPQQERPRPAEVKARQKNDDQR